MVGLKSILVTDENNVLFNDAINTFYLGLNGSTRRDRSAITVFVRLFLFSCCLLVVVVLFC